MDQPRNHIGFVQAHNLAIRSMMLMSNSHYSVDPGVTSLSVIRDELNSKMLR